jgi:hypothetical protein
MGIFVYVLNFFRLNFRWKLKEFYLKYLRRW